MLESSTCTLIIQFKTVLKIHCSQLTQTVTVLMRLMKVNIPIPKFVVTIYRLSFLWPFKRTVHFFYRSDTDFALPFFHPMSLSMIAPAA